MQGLPYIVVSNDYSYSFSFKLLDDILNINDRERINAGKRLI